jgi:hypothetical protein
MRRATVLLAALLSACTSVNPSRIDSSTKLARTNGRPAHYLTCGLPVDENKVRCAEKAAAACVNGFTVAGPYPDLPHLVYWCN